MSKLLKSKFFLGAMIVALLAVGAVVALDTHTAAAANCSITSTLRVGSSGTQVACLQSSLGGLVADGAFGPKTKAAVMSWQSSMGLTADGIFGPKSRAALESGSSMSMTLPAGCTSTAGYSPTTGAKCDSGAMTTTLPAGCTSTSGYSPTTGVSCATGVSNNNPVMQTGPVTAMVAYDTPASGYIVANQATADLAHFTFTGTGTVNSIVLQRTGVSDQNTLSNVYLYDGITRLTDGYSFNNTGQMTINGLSIAINGSKTLSVKADVASVSNASSLGITMVGFTAAGNAASTVNLSGNTMTYGTGNLASVYLSNASQTVGESSGTLCTTGTDCPTVNAGTSAFAIWSSPMQINTREVWLKGANFRMVGSAPSDALTNIKLYVDGVSVGNAATVGSINGTTYAMLDYSGSPVKLTTGSHTLDLRADVVKGSSYTVQVSIQQPADMVLYDAQVGVNIAVLKAASTTYVTSTSGVITINAGSASVVVDPTFNTYTNVTGGATNVVLGKFKVHGYGEDVKVSSLLVKPNVASGATSSGSTTNLNNIAVYFNGSQVGSSANYDGTHDMTFQLGSQMIIPAGVDSYIEIRGDLQNSTGYNYTSGTVTVTLNPAVALTGNGQGQTSHTSVTFPASAIATTGLTIQTGTLAVAANGAYTAQSISPNTANAKVASFTLQNQSTSEPVRVTSLALALTRSNGSTALTNTGSAGVYPALTNFANLKTSETSGSGSTPVQPTASNTFSVDFTLAPGATKTVDVYMDTSSTGASAQFSSTLTVTSIGANSNVSISQNSNGTAVQGQVITLTSGTFNNAGTVVSSSSAPRFVAAAGTGATNATKATFNFKSTSGTATVTELKFLVDTSSGSSVSSVTVNGITAPVVSGVAYITGLNIAVPNGGAGVNVDAYMSYGPVGSNGNTSGAKSFVEMTYIRYKLGTTTTALTGGSPTDTDTTNLTAVAAGVSGTLAAAGSTQTITFDSNSALQPGMIVVFHDATGTDSVAEVQSLVGTTQAVMLTLLLGNTADVSTNTPSAYFWSVPQNAAYSSGVDNAHAMTIAGNSVLSGATSTLDAMVIVGSSPTVGIVDASTPLIPAEVLVGSVTVTADAKGDIKINTLPLTFTSSGNVTIATGTDNLTIKNAADQSTVTTTNDTLAVSANGSDNTTVTFTGGYTVTAGQTVTFDIYATAATVTGGPNANKLSMKLGAAASLTWTDVAGNATSTQTGALILNYPTASSLIND